MEAFFNFIKDLFDRIVELVMGILNKTGAIE